MKNRAPIKITSVKQSVDFENPEDYFVAPNVKLGLHSVSHRHYTELDALSLDLEISEVSDFVSKNRGYWQVPG